MATIVIAGGGICGIAAAVMLADDGHNVTVLERDEAPPPPKPSDAFGWDRKSVAQFGLGHWMHSRGTSILRERVPRAYQLLCENGGYRFNLVEALLAESPDFRPEPDDKRFDLVTGRRSTLEWALAIAADEHPSIVVWRGAAIAGLVTGDPSANGTPHVIGVRLKTGEQVTGDLVIDATGRRSPTPEWLAQIGATAPAEDSEDSGFAYYGRYLQSDDGSIPEMMAPLLTAYGSFSVLSLPADNGTWSLTLYGMADDKPLRRFRDPEVYDRVIRSLPLHRHWLEGEQISKQQFMAGGVDRHRSFVRDGEPCATGMLTVADASSCTNPSLGRGMTLGLMHVEVMRSCIADHPEDPHGLALAFHERTEAELLPYHHATTAADRGRLADMRVYRDGGTPEPTPEDQIAGLVAAAAGSDAIATRLLGDIMGCNALAQDAIAEPGVFEHILGLADTVAVEPVPGPDRDELLKLVDS